MKIHPAQGTMADTSPSSKLKLRPLKRVSAPAISSPVAGKYLSISTSIKGNDEALDEIDETNKLLMSRNFASAHFMDGTCGETSIADLSQVACLQSLAKSHMSHLGRDAKAEEKEEKEDPVATPKSSKGKRRESRRGSTSPARKEEENQYRKEEEDQDKKSRNRRSRSGSQGKEYLRRGEKEASQEMSQRRGRSKSKSFSMVEAMKKDRAKKEDADQKSKRKSCSRSKSFLEGMEVECKDTMEEALSPSKKRYSSPNLSKQGKEESAPSKERRRKNGEGGKSKRVSRAISRHRSNSNPKVHSDDDNAKETTVREGSKSSVEGMAIKCKDKKEEVRSRPSKNNNSFPNLSKQEKEENITQERRRKNGDEGKSKRTNRTISRRRSNSNLKIKSDVDDEKETTTSEDKQGGNRDREQRESKTKRVPRTMSRRRSAEHAKQHDEKDETITDKRNQDTKEGEAKKKLIPRTNSRRRSTERPKKKENNIDPNVSEENEQRGEESKSRHARGGPRLSQRRRSTLTDDYEGNDNDDTAESSKGRMRRSKSHEMAFKKKRVRKTKSMDEKTALLSYNVDADDDTVVADNKADASPGRRVRSMSRRSSASGATPAGSSSTPTNRRVTRRRASLTAVVTEAMAEATEGATTPTSTARRASRRRASGSHRSGHSSGTGTPTSANSRNRGQRSSFIIGGSQLRQALQQEPNWTPACLKDLEDIDDVKLEDKNVEPLSDCISARDNKQQMDTILAEDTDMETDVSEQAAIITRLPTAYLQNSSITSLGAMDTPDLESFREARARRTSSDQLSWSSHHSRSSSTEVSPSTTKSLSSSCHEPRSSSTAALSTPSDHSTQRASSRFSFSGSQDSLSMLSMSGLSSLSSKIKKDLSELSSSSDHGVKYGVKSWFSSLTKQPSALDMPSSSGHGPSKRAVSPSRRAAMHQRGSTTKQMHASASSAGFADLMHTSTSSGFVLPMVKRGEANNRGRRTSLPSRPKEKKVTLLLPKVGKFDDLDDDSDASDDDFAY